jgi:hypothetical protein
MFPNQSASLIQPLQRNPVILSLMHRIGHTATNACKQPWKVLPVGENEEQWNYGPERYPLVSQIILISTPARLYLLDQVADSTIVVNKL